MPRVIFSSAILLLAIMSRAECADQPGAAVVSVGKDGALSLQMTVFKCVPVTRARTVTLPVTRTVEVEEGGTTLRKTVQESVTRTVTYTAFQQVLESVQLPVTIEQLRGVTVAGRKLTGEGLKEALHDGRVVLLSPDGIPTYLRPVFKPDTLILSLNGAEGGLGQGPAGVPPAIFPPAAPVAPAAAAPVVPAPAPPPPPPAAPSSPQVVAPPVNGPAARREAPVGFIPPLLVFASLTDEGDLRLREIREASTTATVTVSSQSGGETRTEEVPVKRRSFLSYSREVPLRFARISGTDGREISNDRVREELKRRKETLVLLSRNGEKVDSTFLGSVQSNTWMVSIPGMESEPPIPELLTK